MNLVALRQEYKALLNQSPYGTDERAAYYAVVCALYRSTDKPGAASHVKRLLRTAEGTRKYFLDEVLEKLENRA